MTVYRKAPILAEAIVIRDERMDRANTATRIGTELQTIVRAMPIAIDVTSYNVEPSYSGTTNDVGISQAVTDALASNGELWWPFGTYPSAASIPNFHTVRHRGPGRILRGSDTFYVEPKEGQTNTLYVATAGSAANDGLSAAQPMATPQDAVAALANYGPVLGGTWRVRLAAGTYGGGLSTVGLQSKNRIEFYGPDVGGHPDAPIAIISGAVSGTTGWYFQRRSDLHIQDVKFIDFTSAGLVADGACDLYTKNVHAENCNIGIDVEQLSQVRLEGGVIDGCAQGVRLYSQCSGAIGYNGSALSNRPQIKNCTTYGVICRDSSRAHVDFVDFEDNTNIAFYMEKVSRGVANDCTFTNNAIAVRAELGCAYGESNPNVFTGNTQDYVLFSSVDETANHHTYFDRATSRWLYGADAYATPPVKHTWVSGTGLSGSSYNSNAKWVFDGHGAINYLALSGPTNHTSGLLWSAPAVGAAGFFTYNTSAARFRFAIAGTERYTLDATGWLPLDDNARDLGSAALRWNDAFATQLRPGAGAVIWTSGAGTPEGAVTAPVGSLYTDTATGDLYRKTSGAGNTGWVTP